MTWPASGNEEPTKGSPPLTAASKGDHVADIMCTVPDCDALAVLVLNGRPICRPHCEDFAKQASIVDGSFRDVLKAPAEQPLPMIAGPVPTGPDGVEDVSTSGLPNGPDPTN